VTSTRDRLETGADPAPHVDRTFDVSGLRLHYRDLGPRDGAPVVMLHGLLGHAHEWDMLTAALATRQRVLVLDQRGHGRSDWAASYTVADLAGDVIELIEHVGSTPVRLVGHSMGGLAAITVAGARPELVERLVVIDVGPDVFGTPFAAELRTFLEELSSASYAAVVDAVDEWMAGNPLADEHHMRHYVEHCLRPCADGRLVWRFDGRGLRSFFDEETTADNRWAVVEAITAPTLVVRGEHSAVLSRAAAEELVHRIAADARLVEVPGGGHDLGVEQPAAVTDAVVGFLVG
jgi:esterase